MMVLLVVQLSSAAAALSPAEKAQYEPYRQCLLAQGGKIAAAADSDETLLKAARKECMLENLRAGTQLLAAEMNARVSKEAATERAALVREAIEAEAVVTIRVASAKGR